jgi:hypothetical protein
MSHLQLCILFSSADYQKISVASIAEENAWCFERISEMCLET